MTQSLVTKVIKISGPIIIAGIGIAIAVYLVWYFGFKTADISVGVFSNNLSELQGLETEIATKLDHILIFQNVTDLDMKVVSNYLDNNYRVILNIEFPENESNLRSITSGIYDEKLLTFITDLKVDGRPVTIRPLHEFNGDWYSWGVFKNGNQPEEFIPAWKHIVTLFRSNHTNVDFQLNYNRFNGKNNKLPFQDLYPGDDWVDMVVITNYNRVYTSEHHNEWKEFSDEFTDAYTQVIAFANKPIGVAEMATVSRGGDKPRWIRRAFLDLATDYPKVTEITWFNENKTVDSFRRDWSLNTIEDKNAFKEGVKIFREERL